MAIASNGTQDQSLDVLAGPCGALWCTGTSSGAAAIESAPPPRLPGWIPKVGSATDTLHCSSASFIWTFIHINEVLVGEPYPREGCRGSKPICRAI